MNVKEKVGLLGVLPTSAGNELRSGAPSPYAATVSSPSATKADRQAAALQLWNKWATEALGPISADPTPEELARKSRRVQRLENECAAMAARAQQRLEISTAIRTTPVVMGNSNGGAGVITAGEGRDGGSAAAGVLLRPGAFSRELQYAVRERRKAAAYAAAKAEGAAEAEAAAGAATDTVSSVGAVGYAPSFKSRAMLDALIASRAAAANGEAADGPAAGTNAGGGNEDVKGGGAAGGSRQRPRSAMPQRSVSISASRTRPRSAIPAGGTATLGRQISMSPRRTPSPQTGPRPGSMAQRAVQLAANGAVAPAAPGLVAVPEGEYLALRQEVDTVSERLAATQAALEVQSDTEAQLREAVDLLRARLHSSGLREVDAQRRLAQHSKLEPLFDRLAECFTFSSPEEVVARLEFLEDDKLGTFDQLLRTQEEVTRLQQRLAEAQKASETVATRLTTEHLQGSARLQEQNEELRQELESMENLVHKLTARQAQLVALQTAVLQLWGKLSDDPQFAEAFLAGAAGAGAITTSGAAAGGRGRAGSAGRTQPGNVSLHGGLEDPKATSAAPSDPLAMLHMIEEFVTAKSNKLAIRHFTDIQRIANHVWQQHFRNRTELRGRVVPTFEQLSKVAGRMADRVKSVQDQAGRSQDAEKQLMREVKRLQQQKRMLETALARRDEQFKSVMGVPRRTRPASAAAELGRIMRREAVADSAAAGNSAAGAVNVTGSGMSFSGAAAGLRPPGASRAVSTVSLSGALAVSGMVGRGGGGRSGELPSDASFSMASGIGAPLLRPHPQPSQLRSPSLRRPRPVSAPNAGSGGAAGAAAAAASGGGAAGSIGTSTSRMRQALYGAMTNVASTTPAAPTGAGGTLAGILSPAVAGQVPQMVADLPMGAHWRQHVGGGATAAALAQHTAPSRLPGGGLHHLAGGIGGAGAAGTASGAGGETAADGQAAVAAAPVGAAEPPAARWAAPQRTAIEQAFLTRLERRNR